MTGNFAAYLQENQARFFMEYLLAAWFPGRDDIDPAYPPEALNENELVALKIALLECIPDESEIVGLYDWDVRFAAELSDDWFFSAVAGPLSEIPKVAEELAEFFLEKVDALDLDYNHSAQMPEEFHALALSWSQDFVVTWRCRIVDRYAATLIEPLVVES